MPGALSLISGHRAFRRLIGAALLARLGNEMAPVGVVLYVLDQSQSGALAGLTIAALTFPAILTGPVLGAWQDRLRHREWPLVADQVLACLSLIGILTAGALDAPGLIVVAALLAGLTYPLSAAGFTALVPAVVPQRALSRANALEGAGINLAIVLGPALAGVVVGLASPAIAVGVQLAIKAAALVLVAAMPLPSRDGPGRAGSTMDHVRRGLRHLADTPSLRAVTFGAAVAMAGRGLLIVAFPALVTGRFGAPEQLLGFVWASFAAGSLAGNLASPRLETKRPTVAIVAGSLIASGLVLALVAATPSIIAAFVVVTLAGLFYGPGLAASFGVRQRQTPSELRGQVFTTSTSLKVSAFACGSAAGGLLLSSVGVTGLLVLAGLLHVIGGLWPALVARGGGWRGPRGRSSQPLAQMPGPSRSAQS
ncbi:MAG: MFS transporter [Solirubrobacterales bacterium]